MKKIYILKYDLIFKNIFKDKDNMKKLLEEALNLKVNEVIFIDTELSVETRYEKLKILDIIVYTDKGIINVEINNGYRPEVNTRNLIYFFKLISSSVEKSSKYSDIKEYIQLNLTWDLNKYVDYDVENKEKLCYSISEDEMHIPYTNLFKIVTYNMDYFIKKWYNNDIEGVNKFMLLLAAPDIDIMREISKGDELMEEITNKVMELNEDPEIYKNITLENDQEKLFNTAMSVSRNEGKEEGKIEGKIEIAKKLFDNGMSLEEISNITELTIEDIKNYVK